MEQIVATKTGNTHVRWQSAIQDKAFDSIRNRKLIETSAEHFLVVLKKGTVSTNVYLCRAHNYAIGLHWLPLGELENIRGCEEFEAVGRRIAQRLQESRGNQNGNIVLLAVEHPRSLLCGETCGKLPKPHQKVLLILFHGILFGCSLPCSMAQSCHPRHPCWRPQSLASDRDGVRETIHRQPRPRRR